MCRIRPEYGSDLSDHQLQAAAQIYLLYTDWLINRLEADSVVQNPFNLRRSVVS